jgi:hypothetical protein
LDLKLLAFHIGSYGKFAELLPEEILGGTIENELAENKSVLREIFEKDLNFIKELLERNNLKFPFANFSKPVHIIKNAFPSEKEQINRRSELIKRMLAQWWICRDTLAFLAEKILIELGHVTQKANRIY